VARAARLVQAELLAVQAELLAVQAELLAGVARRARAA
jgi:hypothetical protein